MDTPQLLELELTQGRPAFEQLREAVVAHCALFVEGSWAHRREVVG